MWDETKSGHLVKQKLLRRSFLYSFGSPKGGWIYTVRCNPGRETRMMRLLGQHWMNQKVTLPFSQEAKDIDYLVVKEDLRAYGEKSPAFLEKVSWRSGERELGHLVVCTEFSLGCLNKQNFCSTRCFIQAFFVIVGQLKNAKALW